MWRRVVIFLPSTGGGGRLTLEHCDCSSVNERSDLSVSVLFRFSRDCELTDGASDLTPCIELANLLLPMRDVVVCMAVK